MKYREDKQLLQQYTAYKKNSRLANLKDTSVPEVYVFLCISMLMLRLKKLSLNEYWFMEKLLKSDIFRELKARGKYMVLLQMCTSMIIIPQVSIL